LKKKKKMKKNKYIYKYSDFLVEQDMMGAPPMPGQPAPAAKKSLIYNFLFMTGSDDAGNSRRKYPDGSTIIEYPAYSIDAPTLTSWIKDNILSSESNKLNSPELEIRQKNLEDIVKGDRTNISNDDLPFIEKLKNAVSANLVGTKAPDVTVVFSDGVPTTEEIDVTFIKHKK
jgi:hypothetical protein